MGFDVQGGFLVTDTTVKRRANVDLSSISIPWLEHPIAFQVFSKDSDPHECGFLAVCADTNGIALRWVGEKNDHWCATWSELRWYIEALRRDGAEIARQQAERAEHIAQMALGQEMADDLVRDQFKTRRTSAVRDMDVQR
jgi:hypothetical protein